MAVDRAGQAALRAHPNPARNFKLARYERADYKLIQQHPHTESGAEDQCPLDEVDEPPH